MSPRKHKPARLATYVDVHTNQMEQVQQDGFVLRHDLNFAAADGHLVLVGRIYCQGRIYIDVRKLLRILPEHEETHVQTVTYNYNVVLENVGNIFRYDSPHPDHNREHHKHVFDVLAGDTEGSVTLDYSDDNWPTLREVIEEAREWFHAHYLELTDLGYVE